MVNAFNALRSFAVRSTGDATWIVSEPCAFLALQMSYLYNMFENQVHETCGTSQCKQELLKYGLTKLKTMSEEALDKMDPYQRGSGDISKFGMCLTIVLYARNEFR